jgi:hypothetical protein
LGGVEDVYSLYHLSRVLLEEEDEKLILASIDDIYESLSLFSVEFSGKDDVGYCIYHQLLVGLSSERVLSVLRLNFGFGVFVATLFSGWVVLNEEDIGSFTIAFASVVFGEDAFGGFKRTHRLELLLLIVRVVDLLIRCYLCLLLVVRKIVRKLFGTA